jgi:hypothetical protein
MVDKALTFLTVFIVVEFLVLCYYKTSFLGTAIVIVGSVCPLALIDLFMYAKRKKREFEGAS